LSPDKSFSLHCTDKIKIRLWKGVIHPIFHLKMFVHVRNMTANCAYMYRVRRGLAILHIYIYIFVSSASFSYWKDFHTNFDLSLTYDLENQQKATFHHDD
jgi:hypothetical protein